MIAEMTLNVATGGGGPTGEAPDVEVVTISSSQMNTSESPLAN